MNACDRKRSRGFTYLGVLFAVAFMGVMLALIAQIWNTYDRRAKEQQLLFIGAAFRDALKRYADATPGPQKQFPMALDDLVRDKRFPDTRRYLRKIYIDPMTGKSDWGLVKAPGGAIVGIYSLAAGAPIKVENFRNGFVFANKKSYSEWIFGATVPPPIASSTAPSNISAGIGNGVQTAIPNTPTTSLATSTIPDPASGAPSIPRRRVSAEDDPRGCGNLARDDNAACAMAGKLNSASEGAACAASAQTRYAECMAGLPLSQRIDGKGYQ